MLNRAANRMARSILAQRSSGEEPIALLLEHGAPMIIALLGVLKAGKLYVPLDPAYPQERITYMLEDAQASLVVTDNRHLSLAKELTQSGRQILNLDEIDTNIDGENIGLAIPPDTLAYILYTSGSTGQPKGVAQNHRNVLHNIMKYTNSAHICVDDRISLLASFSFSAAVTNTFCVLLNGASLFPYNIKEAGLADVGNWLVQEEITVYQSVPTIFRHFLDTLPGEEAFPGSA
jgi:non-ribosomal peptide synthetase component F